MSDVPEETLHDTLSAAFDEAVAAPVEAPVAAPAPVAEPVKTDGAVRDGQGRFAPKTTPDLPAAAGQEAPPEPILPPASWSAQAKADFGAMPAHLQQEVLKREADVAKGFEERATQLKRYEPIESAIAPHRDRLALAGMDEGTYVRSLIAADEMLRGPNRFQALAQIAQTYGIDLRAYTNGQVQPQPAQQPNPYDQRITTLEQQLAQQRAGEEQAARSQNLSAIETFRTDPTNLYFENVKTDMAALIRAGQATGLKDAYEKAIWARSDIRPLLLKQQAVDAAAQAQAQARAKVSQARQASGSVVGSPTPGATSAPINGSASPSIRDSLLEAWPG